MNIYKIFHFENQGIIPLLILLLLPASGCKRHSEGDMEIDDGPIRVGEQVVIDVFIIENKERLKDHEFCYNHYPEILYLVQKGYHGSTYAAFMAAYQLAVTDGNFDIEIENLTRQAFYASSNDFEAWNELQDNEKTVILSWLDRLQPMDWISVRDTYSAGLMK